MVVGAVGVGAGGAVVAAVVRREGVAVALWGGTGAAGALPTTVVEVEAAVGTVARARFTKKSRYVRVTCTRTTPANSAAASRHYATTW